jgi:hypothetical protein
MYNFVITGPDAESLSIQVLVHSCNMLHRKHPNGCCRSGNEQGKMTWQLKWNMSLLTIVNSVSHIHISPFIFIKRLNSSLHGPQYYRYWSLTQAILNTAAKFVMISWVVTERGPTYPSMFCAVPMLFTTILDSLLLGHDMSVGRYTSNYSKTLIIKSNKKPRNVILLLKSKKFMFILFKSSSEA